ncbi:Hypothetical predicted protein [Paramuricea clavata]|uniref:Uncharacterized protein n=1 Tax=Paramuricea clavata TaxID=317549 RepID=A0A6S7HZL5_PARCT|nr:Hypothetical predicted protein [Paramuricea clavata]
MAENIFWQKMVDKDMRVSVEVFALEKVKKFKLVKPDHWNGDAKQQQHLFEHIVSRYLWKHVYEGLPTTHTGVTDARALKLWEDNFVNDIAMGWGSMIKTFLKCVGAFGVLKPDEIFTQKTIPELLKMKYYLFEMNAGSKMKIVDKRYRQVCECVERKEKLKELFEGDACCLAYNDECEWFEDEDEEFTFDENNNNEWFEKAWVEGLKELDEMQNGYQRMRKDEEKQTKHKK